jgi:hypothetical protein
LRSTFHFRSERHYDKPPEAIWPLISDTALINEVAGSTRYHFEEKLDAQGRVHRLVSGRLGPLPTRWEETFGEWQDNRRIVQLRNVVQGPVRRFYVAAELAPEGNGSHVVFTGEIECVGLLGMAVRYSGMIGLEGGRRVAAVDKMVRDLASPDRMPGESAADRITGGARRRLEELAAALARDPASHGLTSRLLEFLNRAPDVAMRGMRPLALAKRWRSGDDETIELFLAAQARGILSMGWDLLCPRCRGAKARATRLDELPTGTHCSSCNVDYRRNFTRNVELTFRPAPWLRQLPEGEYCMLGQSTTPHVMFQADVASQTSARFDLTLTQGAYRVRTVEADGGEAEVEIGADGAIPQIVAQGGEILLREPRTSDVVSISNNSNRPLWLVIEDRRWTADALTGERVIAMSAFRRL